MIKTILIAALASLAFTSVQAEPARTIVARTASTAGLDLASAEGARTMAWRIRVAANAVCGGENRLTFGSPQLQKCRQRAAAEAARRLDAPQVSALLDAPKPHILSQR